MMDPWWTERTGALIGAIGGAGLGSLFGIIGGLSGVLAPRGRGRALIISSLWAQEVIGVASLVAGLTALGVGQPYHVWFPLTLLGIILTPIAAVMIPVMNRVYRVADARRMEAASLRRG